LPPTDESDHREERGCNLHASYARKSVEAAKAGEIADDAAANARTTSADRRLR